MKLLFVFISLISIVSFGQTIHVNGTLVADKEAVKLGEITFSTLPDSTLKKGTYLDSTYFSVNMNSDGEKDMYALIKVPGYIDSLITFTAVDTLVNLGIITLEKNLNLETIDVMFRKEMFKRTMDGITINVEGTGLQNLTNLFEVLKASPKIISPDDQSIQIIGRGSPLILIDRQAIISNDELKAIPANQIDRIEIITNPSAKYKAQGSGNGVIEVYTKDFHLEGYNMTISSDGGVSTQLKPNVGLNLGLSLKKKKFSLSAYMGARYNSSNSYGTNTGITTDDSNRELADEYDSENESFMQYYSVKGAYRLSDNARLAIGLNGYGSSGSEASSNEYAFSQSSEVITRSINSSNNKWTWLSNNAFMNYTVDTDTNQSNLEINLNYANKVNNYEDNLRSEFEYVPTSEKSLFDIRNNSRSIPNIGELRVNYEHVFDTTGWKLGIGGSYGVLFNGMTFDRYNSIDNSWIIDPTQSNSYDYQEHIGAVFLEVSKNWDRISVRAGVRGEYTKLDGYSNSLNKQFMDSSYILPFPSASILFKPVDKFAVTLFYDSGIDRPQFYNYDPFVRQEDSLTIRYGNPFLRPAIEQSFGLDFDLFYSYNVSFNYYFKKDPSSSLSFIDDSTFLTTKTPWNADNQQGISGSLSIPIQSDWIQGWNSVWFDYSKYSFSPLFEREPYFALAYGVYSYLTFMLPKDIQILNRVSINKWGSDDYDGNPQLNWGIRVTKKFNGNKFQIFADVANIVPPRNKFSRVSGNYDYSGNSQTEFTVFKVGFFVKFGRLKAADYIEESTSGESDRL